MRCSECDNGRTSTGAICSACLGGMRALTSSIRAVLDGDGPLESPPRTAQQNADLARDASGEARRSLVEAAVDGFLALGKRGEARALVKELWDDLPTELGELLGLDDLVRRRRVAAIAGPPGSPLRWGEDDEDDDQDVVVVVAVHVM